MSDQVKEPAPPPMLLDALEAWANGTPGALARVYEWRNDEVRRRYGDIVEDLKCPRCLGRGVITHERKDGAADSWKCLCGDGTMRSLVSALEQARLKLIYDLAAMWTERTAHDRLVLEVWGQVTEAQQILAKAEHALNVSPPRITRTPEPTVQAEWRGPRE